MDEEVVRSAEASARDDADALILVDAADRTVGSLSKAQCHAGQGVLHRAFSLLIFDARGALLIQQRAARKRLWPLFWSNSCCSHPRHRESMQAATERRLYEELGLKCPLKFLFKFQYQAQFDATGAENELCSVFIGRCTEPVTINRDEILAWEWVSPETLQAELTAAGPGHGAGGERRFTPWFRMEWARIWAEHRADVRDLR